MAEGVFDLDCCATVVPEKFRPTGGIFSAILLRMSELVHYFTQRLEAFPGR
jgi:hypothetical protein